MTNVEEILSKREAQYGGFNSVAVVSRAIKSTIAANYSVDKPINPVESEALDMVAHKLARIICQQSYDGDSWLDIAGYAMLAHRALTEHKGS